MRTIILAAAAAALAIGGFARARDIQDGKLLVKPAKEGKYVVDNATLGKAEFFGFVGDYVESKKITGLLLRDGDHATDEQKHIVAITAQTQKINAFIEISRKEIALVEPTPSAPATPPPADNVTPVAPAAPVAAAPATPATPATPDTPATPAAPVTATAPDTSAAPSAAPTSH